MNARASIELGSHSGTHRSDLAHRRNAASHSTDGALCGPELRSFRRTRRSAYGDVPQYRVCRNRRSSMPTWLVPEHCFVELRTNS